MLRIRTETREQRGRGKDNGKPEVTLTFKRPTGNASQGSGSEQHKVREEIETQVTDADALAKTFEALGMRVFFRYEKYRTTFRLPESQRWAKELKIELDEEIRVGRLVDGSFDPTLACLVTAFGNNARKGRNPAIRRRSDGGMIPRFVR